MPVFGSLEILPTIIGTTYNSRSPYFRDSNSQFSLKVINVFFLPPSIGPEASKTHRSTVLNTTTSIIFPSAYLINRVVT